LLQNLNQYLCMQIGLEIIVYTVSVCQGS